ncbi:PP2A4 [Symbiodinium natans]|uniref:PP2A4 protein n=1 Tax=Symbiodinium natans TaxID=878477 RepID=A0A812TPC3_9DINO|nr:PP2A4 [Symbiodinium natans]
MGPAQTEAMAQRLSSELERDDEDAVLETPQKRRCVEKATPQKEPSPPDRLLPGLLVAQEALPTFGGLLAEMLWQLEGKHQMRDLHSLLCTSKTAEKALVVGIKEFRLQPEREPSLVYSYAMMCDEVQALHKAAWARSRQLRLVTTEQADRRAAMAIVRAFF